jgi:MFS family permease
LLYGWSGSIITGDKSTNNIISKAVSVIPAQWFLKKRGIANGIVYAGGGLGGAVNSFLLNALIQRLGPPWTFRVMGILTLTTGLPAAWLIRERNPVRRMVFIEW